MDSGFYAACAGMIAKTKQLDSLAHNLANSSSAGFKSQEVTFESLLATNQDNLSPNNRAINNYGVASNPSLNLSAGTIERTGNDLDMAVEGDGFFTIQSGKETRYTRNGHFSLSSQGQLQTASGDLVLGDAGPIVLPAGKQITISPDGQISADATLVGKVRLTEFNPSAQLTEITPSVFTSNQAPRATTNSQVRQGSLESSNVNGVEAAVSLIVVQREAEMLQRAMSMFHSEFNRIAANDLPKV